MCGQQVSVLFSSQLVLRLELWCLILANHISVGFLGAKKDLKLMNFNSPDYLVNSQVVNVLKREDSCWLVEDQGLKWGLGLNILWATILCISVANFDVFIAISVWDSSFYWEFWCFCFKKLICCHHLRTHCLKERLLLMIVWLSLRKFLRYRCHCAMVLLTLCFASSLLLCCCFAVLLFSKWLSYLWRVVNKRWQ